MPSLPLETLSDDVLDLNRSQLEELGLLPKKRSNEIEHKMHKSGGYQIRNAYRELELSESKMQQNLFQWLANLYSSFPVLREIFAVPNGGKRPKRTAAIMKAEGQKKGVPDILAFVPTADALGLAIEHKVGYNYPSPDQREWLQRFKNRGIATFTSWSERDSREIICEYFGLPTELASQ